MKTSLPIRVSATTAARNASFPLSIFALSPSLSLPSLPAAGLVGGCVAPATNFPTSRFGSLEPSSKPSFAYHRDGVPKTTLKSVVGFSRLSVSLLEISSCIRSDKERVPMSGAVGLSFSRWNMSSECARRYGPCDASSSSLLAASVMLGSVFL